MIGSLKLDLTNAVLHVLNALLVWLAFVLVEE